jgi:hypothetical protein
LRKSNFSHSLGMVAHAQGSRASQRASDCRLLALLTIQGLFVIIASSQTVLGPSWVALMELWACRLRERSGNIGGSSRCSGTASVALVPTHLGVTPLYVSSDLPPVGVREPAFLVALDSDLATVELCRFWLARAFVGTAVLLAGVSVLRIGRISLLIR